MTSLVYEVFFHPKARTHQSSFERGHFVCPEAKDALNLCGYIVIVDVRRAKVLFENSTLFAKNFARAKIPCG